MEAQSNTHKSSQQRVRRRRPERRARVDVGGRRPAREWREVPPHSNFLVLCLGGKVPDGFPSFNAALWPSRLGHAQAIVCHFVLMKAFKPGVFADIDLDGLTDFLNYEDDRQARQLVNELIASGVLMIGRHTWNLAVNAERIEQMPRRVKEQRNYTTREASHRARSQRAGCKVTADDDGNRTEGTTRGSVEIERDFEDVSPMGHGDTPVSSMRESPTGVAGSTRGGGAARGDGTVCADRADVVRGVGLDDRGSGDNAGLHGGAPDLVGGKHAGAPLQIGGLDPVGLDGPSFALGVAAAFGHLCDTDFIQAEKDLTQGGNEFQLSEADFNAGSARHRKRGTLAPVKTLLEVSKQAESLLAFERAEIAALSEWISNQPWGHIGGDRKRGLSDGEARPVVQLLHSVRCTVDHFIGYTRLYGRTISADREGSRIRSITAILIALVQEMPAFRRAYSARERADERSTDPPGKGRG